MTKAITNRKTDAGTPDNGGTIQDSFFRNVVQGMRCGIITVDRFGRVILANELARQILQIDRKEVELLPVSDVLAHHPRLAEVLVESLSMSHLPNRAEMEIRSREDDGRTIGFTISTIPGESSPEGVALFFKDLTQVEQREERERLRDRLAALGEMAASLAHEIRNPLASIEVTATLLRRRIAGREEDLRLVDKIAAEVSRLNRLVTQSLEYARVLCPDTLLQSVVPLVERALDEALSRFPNHKLHLSRNFDPSTPPVPVDANLIQQVFVNLIVNAIEAMHGNGTLSIEIRPVGRLGGPPRGVEVAVLDSGPGISDEVRDKIFSPFITTKKTGSGIGLAVARKIVECHHGLIDVETKAGVGTTFRVRLPLPGEERDVS